MPEPSSNLLSPISSAGMARRNCQRVLASLVNPPHRNFPGKRTTPFRKQGNFLEHQNFIDAPDSFWSNWHQPLLLLGRELMRCRDLFACVLIFAIMPNAALAIGTNHLLNTNWATSSSQNGFDPARSVDGIVNPRAGAGIPCEAGQDSNCDRGWALYENATNTYQDANAVFETLTDLTDTELTLTLSFRYNVSFLLGAFQVQVTDDDRPNFADNDSSNGQLGNSWTTITPNFVSFVDYNALGPDLSGSSLYVDSARSNLANGELFIAAQGATYPLTTSAVYPNGADYNLIFDNPFPGGLTGIRINALYNSDLPVNGQTPLGGPGVASGNAILTEASLRSGAVPEPTTGLLTGLGLLYLARLRRTPVHKRQA